MEGENGLYKVVLTSIQAHTHASYTHGSNKMFFKRMHEAVYKGFKVYHISNGFYAKAFGKLITNVWGGGAARSMARGCNSSAQEAEKGGWEGWRL